MFQFYRSTKRRAIFTLIVALVVTLIFSSWGIRPQSFTLQEQAGAAAFNTVTVRHQLKLNDQDINYQTTTGYATVNLDDLHAAKVFYTAYTSGIGARPVTFVFNGGPGSSSIWLHMGSFGPVRAVSGKKGYQDNPDTWLTFTDLVFIDPVGTGYSRPEDGTAEKRFYNYQADIRTVGRFVQQYLQENKRQQSPLYFAGESYGAARAVGLAAYLQDTLQIPVAGLTLISPALNYRLISFNKGNDAPFPYYLSAYAAAAQFHQRLTPELQALPAKQLQAKVDAFAFGPYQKFLKGDVPLSQIIDSLSAYTSIDVNTLRRVDGRVSDVSFTYLLLNKAQQQTGTYDARETGSLTGADPSEMRLRAVFPQAFQQYRQVALHYETKLPYLATIATSNWNYGSAAATGYLNVVPALKTLLQRSPNLKVQVVSGRYDLATPSATVNASVGNLAGKQLNVAYYNAGHMLYTDNKANTEWRKNSQAFYERTIN